ncbi:MATE family efflux transporter [Clostridium sp.]|uniref:MATE family efflux transporter n=1 Tax=Clostridium sp. TaxID=1506 RepID=UPI0025C57945|nr:MATE family efflux transporter [Clostridium sp.]
MKNLNLLEDNTKKLFINFALPGVISALAMCLYGIVDGIILGRFVNSNALAAVNMASPIFNIISCFGILIAIGGNTLTGISLGQKDIKKANNYFNNSFFTLFLVSILIFIIIVFFPNLIAKLVGANDSLLPLVSKYIQTFGFFIIPICLNILLGISLQSIGKPSLYMIGNMLSVFINIVLDIIFVCFLNMGIFGAALSSGISATLVFLVFLLQFINQKSILRIRKFTINLKAVLHMAYNGSSEAITQFSSGFSAMIFNWILITKFGEVGVSSFSIVQYISLVVTAIIMGMSRGITPIISVNYGANYYKRIKELISLSIKIVTIIGGLAALILIIFKIQLISIFIRDNVDVINTSSEIIKYYSLSFLFIGSNIILNSFYTAINDPKTSAILSILRYVLLICSFFVLPYIMGNVGLWLSFSVAELLCLFISLVYYKNTSSKFI